MFTRYPRKALWVGDGVGRPAGGGALLRPAARRNRRQPGMRRFRSPRRRGSLCSCAQADVKARVATAAELVYRRCARHVPVHLRQGYVAQRLLHATNAPRRGMPPWQPRTSRPDGDWSLLDRADGTRQWLYRGAPLYGFAEDKARRRGGRRWCRRRRLACSRVSARRRHGRCRTASRCAKSPTPAALAWSMRRG